MCARMIRRGNHGCIVVPEHNKKLAVRQERGGGFRAHATEGSRRRRFRAKRGPTRRRFQAHPTDTHVKATAQAEHRQTTLGAAEKRSRLRFFASPAGRWDGRVSMKWASRRGESQCCEGRRRARETDRRGPARQPREGRGQSEGGSRQGRRRRGRRLLFREGQGPCQGHTPAAGGRRPPGRRTGGRG